MVSRPVYYNEINTYCARWLVNLIGDGLIPKGEVDTRSIKDVKPSDLKAFKHCHFFAGIGGWPFALELVGWPENEEVWTGSCPCQPFSVAGKRKGASDKRHLWPEFLHLIKESRPSTILGEQVARKDGRKWLAGVRSDLEILGYAVGAADLCSASVGAPTKRERLFFVSCTSFKGFQIRTNEFRKDEESLVKKEGQAIITNSPYRTAGSSKSRRQRISGSASRKSRHIVKSSKINPWKSSSSVEFTDGKTRRIEPGLECLVDGIPFKLADGRTRKGASRKEIIKALGNAINPWLAAEFIAAYMEIQGIS